MFGNLGQLAGLLKNAGQIKENMKQMQERLAAARHEGESGGGQVRATVDGRGELVALKLEPSLWQTGDAEMTEDLIVAAVQDATKRCREAAAREMEAATGGLNLQGMMDMLGK